MSFDVARAHGRVRCPLLVRWDDCPTPAMIHEADKQEVDRANPAINMGHVSYSCLHVDSSFLKKILIGSFT